MQTDRSECIYHQPGHDLYLEHEDAAIRDLHRIIRIAVKVLAVLMVVVIAPGVTYWLATREGPRASGP